MYYEEFILIIQQFDPFFYNNLSIKFLYLLSNFQLF